MVRDSCFYIGDGLLKGVTTRMLSAARDGSDLRLVSDHSDLSHFEWRDPEHITIWHEDGYYLYEDDGSNDPEFEWHAPSGHQSYLPDKDWLVTDTYPLEKNGGRARPQSGTQHLYLYHLPTGQFVPLGRFYSHKEYLGTDPHHRVERNGKIILFDSVHEKDGRQI